VDVLLTILGVVVSLVVVAALILFIGFRARAPWALDVMRQVTKFVFNPLYRRTAGNPGAFAGVIEHRGRVSGATYRTPVGIRPTDDGFVIVLPYDTRPDWVRNVLASGRAVITVEGETTDVEHPEVLPIAWALPFFDEKDRGKMGAITQCVRLRTVEPVRRNT
jgi:deazaflavin-dependent oxidoreductase (nitroreductase family)